MSARIEIQASDDISLSISAAGQSFEIDRWESMSYGTERTVNQQSFGSSGNVTHQGGGVKTNSGTITTTEALVSKMRDFFFPLSALPVGFEKTLVDITQKFGIEFTLTLSYVDGVKKDEKIIFQNILIENDAVNHDKDGSASLTTLSFKFSKRTG